MASLKRAYTEPDRHTTALSPALLTAAPRTATKLGRRRTLFANKHAQSSQQPLKRQRTQKAGGVSTASGDSSPAPHLIPNAGPSTPTKSRVKSAAAGKRLARFKSKCPQSILDRVERVLSQRFFMVDRKREGKELKETFNVLGSTGNVYKVTIGKEPECSCPDAMKGNHCKHIMFIFLKVLQVPQSSHVWYQKALLSDELETIFAHAPLAPNALAHPRVLEAYARATGKMPSTSQPTTDNRRIPGEGDDCPVCYESMHGALEKSLTFCDACGNGLHAECFRQWANAALGGVTCVWCRARWVQPKRSEASTSRDGYLNLGGAAGLSPVRDTSSYYSGPRRAQPYRYGFWDDE